MFRFDKRDLCVSTDARLCSLSMEECQDSDLWNAICSTLSHAPAHFTNQLKEIDRIVQKKKNKKKKRCDFFSPVVLPPLDALWDYFTSDTVIVWIIHKVCLCCECKPLILTTAAEAGARQSSAVSKPSLRSNRGGVMEDGSDAPNFWF